MSRHKKRKEPKLAAQEVWQTEDLFPELSMQEVDSLLKSMEGFITSRRNELFDQALAARTRHLSLVLEDVYQPHNASAVLRSCDCFGIQDVHVMESRYTCRVNNDVSMGAARWLNLHRYNAPEGQSPVKKCYDHLRAKGYTIVATTPAQDEILLPDLPIGSKTAIVFGTEEQGLSQEAIEQADLRMRIPMHGFTESFNVSVCAAIVLYELSRRMRGSDIAWQLSQEEQKKVRLEWIWNMSDNNRKAIRAFLNKI